MHTDKSREGVGWGGRGLRMRCDTERKPGQDVWQEATKNNPVSVEQQESGLSSAASRSTRGHS